MNYHKIILEQKEELNLLLNSHFVPRKKSQAIDLSSNLAQIITGVRRSGKSTLAIAALKNKHFAYVNFDDERLINLKSQDLDEILELLYIIYGDFEILLLDEIQNVDSWHLFVNRLLRKKINIILTGSNSKLLSQEMASHLTGRYNTIELLPYSFEEFLEAKDQKIYALTTAKEKGLATKLFIEYLQHGGFPEVTQGENPELYLNNLFEAIVTRDIIYRYAIKHVRAFREMALWIADNFASEISYNRLKNIFGLGSENTVKNYIAYLEEAWLFMSLEKFAFKKQESLRNRKIYLIDSGFATLYSKSGGQNEGRILENIVYLQLVRYRQKSRYEIYYYKSTIEIDFVLYKNRQITQLIQVCWSLEDAKTKKREIKALLKAAEELKTDNLKIVTFTTKETIRTDHQTIEIIPITEFLTLDII